MFEICKLSATELDSQTNAPLTRATLDITDEEGDDVNFGDLPVFSQLGVTAIPAPIDNNGKCEGIVLRRCEGVDGVIIGARDTRSSTVYAALKPGDTALHATDGKAAAQFQAKANRQAIVATKDTSGKTMVVNLDGKNDKVQVAAFGALFEIDKAKDQVFICTPSGKASIVMSGGTISLIGTVILGGATPLVPMAAAPAIGPAGYTQVPGVFQGV